MQKWQSCNPIDLFTAPIVRAVNSKQKDVATHLYIWTGCNREGEAVGSEIVGICRRTNPQIVVKRAHFSSVLPQKINRAMQNPHELDVLQVAAVEAHSELDLWVGSALTRFQTLRLQSRFAAVKDKIISYGSCQFPTPGFVVDQFRRVENFVPEPFWYMFMDHVKDDGKAVFKWKQSKLFDQEICLALYSSCIENTPCLARVTSVKSQPKDKRRPLPLTTVEMQKGCSKFLKLAPDKIMTIAESLYNKGFISYPRTETDQFDKNMNLQGIVNRLTHYTPFASYANRLISGNGFQWPRWGQNNDKNIHLSQPPWRWAVTLPLHLNC